MNLGGAHSRDPDVQLIDKVEEAQVHSPVTKQDTIAELVNLGLNTRGNIIGIQAKY